MNRWYWFGVNQFGRGPWPGGISHRLRHSIWQWTRFHQHTAEVTAKANHVLGLISKSFEYLDPNMLIRLFKTLVWPIIEYGNTIMGTPFHSGPEKDRKHTMQSLAHALFQLLMTNPMPSNCLCYITRATLEFRHLRGGPIFMYELINNHFNTDFSSLLTYSNN